MVVLNTLLLQGVSGDTFCSTCRAGQSPPSTVDCGPLPALELGHPLQEHKRTAPEEIHAQ